MAKITEKRGGPTVDEADTETWAFRENVAVRALLDHVAEELAAEFVRLMRAGIPKDAEPMISKKREK
jgi:hypothetical protein